MQIAYSSRTFAKSSFSDVTKVQIAVLEVVRSQRIRYVFTDKGKVETSYWAPLYYLK